MPDASDCAYEKIPTLPKGAKLAVLSGVREYMEREAVELWLNRYGRVVIRAYNECRNNHTDVDLTDLLDWFRLGSVP